MKKRVIFIGILILCIISYSIYANAPPAAPPVPSITGNDGDLNQISQPRCDDNEQNQDETDIDCGGSCSPCANYEMCNVSSDCLSGYCNSEKRCMTTSGSTNEGSDSSSAGWGYGQDNNQETSNTQTYNQQTQNNNKETPAAKQEEMYSPENKSNKLFISSLIINGLLVAGLVVVVMNKKQTPPVAKTIQKQTDPNIERLKSYIQSNMQVGYQPQQIRDFLISQNWPQQTVDEAFNSMRW